MFSSASWATTFGSTAGASAVAGVAGVGLYQYFTQLSKRKKRREAEVKQLQQKRRAGKRSINSPLHGSIPTNSGRGGGKHGRAFSVENPLQRGRM